MKPSDRKKRWVIVTGLGVVCILLVIAIISRFKTETTIEVEEDLVTSIADTVAPSIKTLEESEDPVDTQEVNVQTIASTEAEKQIVDTGDSSGTEQKIQSEVTKPAEPLEQAKKDPTQTPSGQKVPFTTQSEESEVSSTSAPTQTPTQTPTTESTDTHEGEIYVPGFGWVEDYGGGVSQETVEDMYENGNKIGSMD